LSIDAARRFSTLCLKALSILVQKIIPLAVSGKSHAQVFNDSLKRILGQLIGLHVANGIHIDGEI
jgi:hypothetical protein